MANPRTFKALRSFTLRGKAIKAGDTVEGTVAEYKNLISKGYLELNTGESIKHAESQEQKDLAEARIKAQQAVDAAQEGHDKAIHAHDVLRDRKAEASKALEDAGEDKKLVKTANENLEKVVAELAEAESGLDVAAAELAVATEALAALK